MQPLEQIKSYVKTVCEQICWRKACPAIAEEIENHLVDQRDAYIAEGAGEADATSRAVAQMGDPIVVGAQLSRTHRPRPQWVLLAATAALLIAGLIIFLLTYPGEVQWATLVFWTLIGVALMAGAYFADFTLIGRYPKTVYFSILAFSVVAMLLYPEFGGSRLFGGIRFITLLPLLFPLGFAAVVYAAKGKGYLGIVQCGFAYLVPALLALLIPSSVGMLLYTVAGIVILCVAIAKGWFNVKKSRGYLLVFIPMLLVVLVALFWVLQADHRMVRLLSLFGSSAVPTDAGQRMTRISELLRASAFVGHGAPLEAGDTTGSSNVTFLITMLIYRTGWISFVLILLALGLFIALASRLCLRQQSVLALLVSMAVLLTFSLQALGYIAANLALVNIDPISLPLLSYSPMTTAVNLALVGVMLSVFRTGFAVRDHLIREPSGSRLVKWFSHSQAAPAGEK